MALAPSLDSCFPLSQQEGPRCPFMSRVHLQVNTGHSAPACSKATQQGVRSVAGLPASVSPSPRPAGGRRPPRPVRPVLPGPGWGGPGVPWAPSAFCSRSTDDVPGPLPSLHDPSPSLVSLAQQAVAGRCGHGAALPEGVCLCPGVGTFLLICPCHTEPPGGKEHAPSPGLAQPVWHSLTQHAVTSGLGAGGR